MKRIVLPIILLQISMTAWAQTEAPTQPPMETEVKTEKPTDTEFLGKPVQRGDADEVKRAEETWGAFDPGRGFLVGRSPYGTMNLSGYMLLRYINQLPPEQTTTDHLGRERVLDPRNDIQLHREMIWIKGWAYDPRLTYTFMIWGLNSTNATALPGSLNFEFNDHLTIGGGIEGMPGIRSLNGQHPYFLGTDRQLAEDYFRPGFTSGVWVRGKLADDIYYRVMIGDNLSVIGINAAELTRDLAYGGSVWWMPTTGEFGPRGGFGDYEMHKELATRFGISSTYSREDRFNTVESEAPENTQLRISDGTLLFETGALAPGVTLQKADYTILSVDAGMKYQGFFAFIEYYMRWLNSFQSDGPLPIDQMFDHGFEIQIADQVIPQKLEIYGAYSHINGNFNLSREVTAGANYYPFNTRNFRLNGSVSYVETSAYGSLFGYFLGGQTGTIVALSTDIFL